MSIARLEQEPRVNALITPRIAAVPRAQLPNGGSRFNPTPAPSPLYNRNQVDRLLGEPKTGAPRLRLVAKGGHPAHQQADAKIARPKGSRRSRRRRQAQRLGTHLSTDAVRYAEVYRVSASNAWKRSAPPRFAYAGKVRRGTYLAATGRTAKHGRHDCREVIVITARGTVGRSFWTWSSNLSDAGMSVERFLQGRQVRQQVRRSQRQLRKLGLSRKLVQAMKTHSALRSDPSQNQQATPITVSDKKGTTFYLAGGRSVKVNADTHRPVMGIAHAKFRSVAVLTGLSIARVVKATRRSRTLRTLLRKGELDSSFEMARVVSILQGGRQRPRLGRLSGVGQQVLSVQLISQVSREIARSLALYATRHINGAVAKLFDAHRRRLIFKGKGATLSPNWQGIELAFSYSLQSPQFAKLKQGHATTIVASFGQFLSKQRRWPRNLAAQNEALFAFCRVYMQRHLSLVANGGANMRLIAGMLNFGAKQVPESAVPELQPGWVNRVLGHVSKPGLPAPKVKYTLGVADVKAPRLVDGQIHIVPARNVNRVLSSYTDASVEVTERRSTLLGKPIVKTRKLTRKAYTDRTVIGFDAALKWVLYHDSNTGLYVVQEALEFARDVGVVNDRTAVARRVRKSKTMGTINKVAGQVLDLILRLKKLTKVKETIERLDKLKKTIEKGIVHNDLLKIYGRLKNLKVLSNDLQSYITAYTALMKNHPEMTVVLFGADFANPIGLLSHKERDKRVEFIHRINFLLQAEVLPLAIYCESDLKGKPTKQKALRAQLRARLGELFGNFHLSGKLTELVYSLMTRKGKEGMITLQTELRNLKYYMVRMDRYAEIAQIFDKEAAKAKAAKAKAAKAKGRSTKR